MAFSNPITGGQGALIRPAIKSPDYDPGVSGWSINRDGSAEFNNLTVRGTFNGTDYVVSEDGIFFYDGTPAAGNMTGSWAPMNGIDPYGNAYIAGLTLYSSVGNVFLGGLDGVITSTGSSGSVINVEDGQISLYNGVDTNTALIVQNLDRLHGSLYLAGGSRGNPDEKAAFGVVTSYGAPVAGSQDTYPRTSTSAYSEAVVAHHYVSGAVIRSDLSGNTGETWHTPTMGTGWATGPGGSGSYPPLKYRLDAEDNCHIFGCFHTTSTSPGSPIASGFPAVNMTPLGGVAVIGGLVRFQGAVGTLGTYLNSAGEFRFANSLTYAVNDTFMVDCKVPLGNIS